MSALDRQELVRALQARGLVPADAAFAPPPTITGTPRPWYISLLLGVSGWLAGLFLLVFVALLVRPTTAAAAASTGMVLLAAAWGLYKADREGAFTAQLALAQSIAGQCLVIFALSQDLRSVSSVAGSAIVLQAALVLLMPNPLHRTLSMLFALCAWAVWLRLGLFGAPYWNTSEAAAPALGAALLGWLLTWGPMLAALGYLLRSEAEWMAIGWAPVMRPLLSGLIIGLAFATLLSQPFVEAVWWSSGALPAGLAIWPLLSAGAALCGLAAAFALRSRALMGGCVVAVLLHVSCFYYALGVSLLFKSLLMLALGAALLLAARSVANATPRAKP